MRRSLALLFLISLSLPAIGQGLRFGDQNPVQRTAVIAGYSGNFVTAVPATVNFCGFPANAVPCTNKATTYTDITLATPCSTAVQITINNSNACVGATDSYGNWGVWAPVGNYTYTYTIAGQSYGPFLATASVGGGNLAPGTNKQCVFNDNAAFGASSACQFDKASGNLTIGGVLTSAGTVTTASGSWFVNSPFGATAKSPVSGQNGITFDTAAGTLLCSANGAAYSACAGGGGGGTPAGASLTLQYNNAGAFGGISGSSVDGSGNVTLPAKLKMSLAGSNIYGDTIAISGGSTPLAFGATESYLSIAPAGGGFFLTDGTGKGIQSDATNVIISNGSGGGAVIFPHNFTMGKVGALTGVATFVGTASGSKTVGCSNGTCDQIKLDATGGSVNILGGLNFNSATVGISGYGSVTSGTVLGAGTIAGNNAPVCTDGSGNLTLTTSGCPTGGTVTHTAGNLTANQLISGQGGADLKVNNLTGDVTTSGAMATTLASVGSAGSCGSGTQTCQATFDAKGRETAQANTTITPPFSAITGTLATAQLPLNNCIFTNRNDNAATGANAFAAPNSAMLWGFWNTGLPCTSTQVAYVIAVADNTANLYDIGIYGCAAEPCGGGAATGTLVCHTGPQAGSSIFAVAGNMKKALAWTSSCVIPTGRYYFAVTTNCAAACAKFNGSNSNAIMYLTATSVSGITVAGTLNNITLPVDNPTGAASMIAFLIY